MTSPARSLAFVSTLIVALAVAGEWIAHRIDPLPVAPPAIGTPIEYVGSAFRPIHDAAALWSTAPTVAAELDSLGLRTPHGDDPVNDALRILVLGDGNAFGIDVPAARTYCARLQDFFDRSFGRGMVAIRNGAVPGHTVAQASAWFASRLAAWQPDLVVIAFGNGTELEPASEGRSDLEWISAARTLRTRSWLRVLDVVRDAFAATPAESFAPARVRVSATQFADARAALVGDVRTVGAEPLLLAPTVPTGRVGQEARDTSLALYRECVRRVAGASGCGHVDPARSLGADAFAFCTTQPRLSERGHAIVARTLVDALLGDAAVKERVAQKTRTDAARTRAAVRRAAFDVIGELMRHGPIAATAPQLEEPLRAFAPEDTGLPAFELLRAVVDAPLDAAHDRRFAALESFEAPLPARELCVLRATLRGDRARADAVLTTPSGDAPLRDVVEGWCRSATDPIEAVLALQRAIDRMPGQPLPLFLGARAARVAGDTRRAKALVHAGFECLSQDSAEPRGLTLLRDDSDAAAVEFLDREPVLFAATQPAALLRLTYWAWVCEPLTRADGHAILRWGFRLGAAGFEAEIDRARGHALAWAAGDAEREASIGYDLLKRGDATAAAAALDRSLAARDAAEARYLRALIALDAAPDEALTHLDRAIALTPDDGRLHLARGRCFVKLGRRDDAAAAFTRALEIWPDSAETKALLDKTRAE
ncbi:MAG: tetratricopeptide repeat protein [Planctomycetes bacterium]|nr:tetratricopeptide repeat protein [Planctomycetota bacterium]